MAIEAGDAERFLTEGLGLAVRNVAHLGAGAWSTCFGFRCAGADLVIRFGTKLDDFEKDRFASTYRAPGLAIPRVRDIGEAFDGHYAVSERVFGTPLERRGTQQWLDVVPALVELLEAMRTTDPSTTTTWGVWDGNGRAPHESLAAFLLSADDDAPTHRTHGWRAKLQRSTAGDAAFCWGYALLESIAEQATDGVSRSLVHCDLMNRNVHVADAAIAGVFDWGCAIYGDHLCDLAWLQFWGPWFPELDLAALRAALDDRWRDVGYEVANRAARELASYLYIGLTHLAYNAYLEDWKGVADVEARMRELVGLSGC